MKRHKILLLLSGVFGLIALISLGIALWPANTGIRIPVNCANGKMGYIDDAGHMVIDPEWTNAGPFESNGTATASREQTGRRLGFYWDRGIPKIRLIKHSGRRYWRLDRSGRKHSAPSTSPVYPLSLQPKPEQTRPDSWGMVMNRDRYGNREIWWTMTDGSPAFPGRWEDGFNFANDDPAAVKKDGKWGFINRKGETTIPFEWDNALGFDGNGHACVALDDRWGVINPAGRLIIPPRFRNLERFDEKGMAAASLQSGSGFIDVHGKIVIPFRYLRTRSFDRFDMAQVELKNDQGESKIGWIDRTGKGVIPAIYESRPTWQMEPFDEQGLLPVADAKGFGLIKRDGTVVVPLGLGSLKLVTDPIAPGEYWLVRIPGNDPSRAVGFAPGCYDAHGKLIWDGKTQTSRNTAIVCALLSAVISGAFLAVFYCLRGGKPGPSDPSERS